MTTRRRLDAELVRRGLAPSRTQAQADIAAGRVLVGGAVAAKPARLVGAGRGHRPAGAGAPVVSRGGAKLDAALDRFAVRPGGPRVLDAGASTGGFTDCLLQRGAAEVVAVDVGYGQLHERVAGRRPRRGSSIAPTCATSTVGDGRRRRRPGRRRPVVHLAAIGARRPARRARARAATLVVLVKPQFEAGRRSSPGAGASITDPDVWRRVLEEVMCRARRPWSHHHGAHGVAPAGADGNVEFLLHAGSAAGAEPAGPRRRPSTGPWPRPSRGGAAR